MNTEKKENLTNDAFDQQVEGLADLPVTEEQAEDAKGGAVRPTEQISVNFTKIQY